MGEGYNLVLQYGASMFGNCTMRPSDARLLASNELETPGFLTSLLMTSRQSRSGARVCRMRTIVGIRAEYRAVECEGNCLTQESTRNRFQVGALNHLSGKCDNHHQPVRF